MNMARLRQILELRRATKAPPLIPPRTKRGSEDSRRGLKEIVDVHLSVSHRTESVVLIFSESEDSRTGPWKVITASDILPRAECFDLNSVFSIEFQLERCQFIKVDICEWQENNAVSLGYSIFAISELVIKYGSGIDREIVEDESGQKVADLSISCTLRPKPHSLLLQFCAKGITKKSLVLGSAVIFFEMRRLCFPSEGNVLYKSESVKFNNKITFRTFSVQSVDVADGILEVCCYYREGKGNKVLVGSFETTYESLRTGPSLNNIYSLTYENSKNQRKFCGEFELVKFNEMALPSFLEFVTTGTVINVAFAIDFSQPSSTVEQYAVQQYVDDVELAIKTIGGPLRDFTASSAYAAFGFGAKVPPQYRESQEFCLSLDTDPYCRGLDGVLDNFRTAFATTQPITTAHLSHVIYYVSKLAQNSITRCRNGNVQYYVLVLITRGIFDDIKETVQAIIFASRAPISIIFVGVGSSDLSELGRLGTAGTRLNYHGRKPERDCSQFVSVPACRADESNKTDLMALIGERALGGLPWQFTNWMSRNGVKPRIPEPTSSVKGR